MRALFALLSALLLWSVPAAAHDARPVLVSIREQSENYLTVRVIVPSSVPAYNRPEVVLPRPCRPIAEQVASGFLCESRLSGTLSLAWPRFNPSLSTLLRIERVSGAVQTVLAAPAESHIDIPPAEDSTRVAGQFLVLGIEHILLGYDHLLFLLCLLLIAGTWTRIAITVTGFTVAHSITLAASVLGIVTPPVPVIESAIALSIVFLATEIARKQRDTLVWRHPIAVSYAFGLLHGFGFAAALAEIGLPSNQKTLALLMFNIGVEAGQILFVGGVSFALSWIAKILSRGSTAAAGQFRIGGELALAYSVGTIACFWVIDRVSAFVT